MPPKLGHFALSTVNYVYHLFTIPYLLKTILAPWRRDIAIPVNPSIQQRFQALIDNLISRLIGLMVRTATITAGLAILIASFALIFSFIIFWIFAPVISIFLLYFGLVGIF